MKARNDVTREALKAEALRLHREEGIGPNHIARRLRYTTGHVIPSGTVRRWVDPKYAEKARQRSREAKRKRTGMCSDCGGPTSYSGSRKDSLRCKDCDLIFRQSEEYRRSRMTWPSERIIEAIHDWHALYGDPPAMTDWNPYGARALGDELRARRFEQHNGRFPTFSTVIHHFGTWNAAIRAAGFAGRAASGGGDNWLRRRDQPKLPISRHP